MRFAISLAVLISTAYGGDFTTYIGPANVGQSVGVAALAVDVAGDTFVTGSNAFVTKLDPAGNIVFTVAIGPAGSYGTAIALDPAGNIWVGGQTVATNFPLVNALQSTGAVNGVGFLVKMTADGTVLYSSYFGGVLGNSGVYGIATDQNGDVYVTGFTDASDFPTTAGLPASPVSGGSATVYGLFAAKLNSTGQKILYSTVIAGPANCAFCCPLTTSQGQGIAIDGSGNAFVAGHTSTTDLPVTAGGSSGPGAFVFKINAAGSELGYFTYLGSGVAVGNIGTPDINAARPIAVDASGNAYVGGNGGAEGLVIKLSPAGAMVWSASVPGPYASVPNAISLDGSDNVWLTGASGSLAELSADGSAFLYSLQLPPDGAGQDIAIDASGVVHFAGPTGLISTLTPTEHPAPRLLSILNAAAGKTSGLIAPGEVVTLYGVEMGPTNPLTATPQNGLFPTSLGGVQVLVNGSPIPLLYVSASQINAEIPSTVGGVENEVALVQVLYNSAPLPDFRVAVVGSDFAVFEKAGGSMAVINQDGSVNRLANPAKVGGTASIWATGFGATGPPADGAIVTAANNYCNSCQLTFSNGSSSVTETAQYAGTSPGLIDGLMQINFTIPALLVDQYGGGFVSFTPPGYPESIQLGWVNVTQ